MQETLSCYAILEYINAYSTNKVYFFRRILNARRLHNDDCFLLKHHEDLTSDAHGEVFIVPRKTRMNVRELFPVILQTPRERRAASHTTPLLVSSTSSCLLAAELSITAANEE